MHVRKKHLFVNLERFLVFENQIKCVHLTRIFKADMFIKPKILASRVNITWNLAGRFYIFQMWK